MITKAWDMFILYTEHYEKFCDAIFGGWLDKYEPRSEEDDEDALKTQ